MSEASDAERPAGNTDPAGIYSPSHTDSDPGSLRPQCVYRQGSFYYHQSSSPLSPESHAEVSPAAPEEPLQFRPEILFRYVPVQTDLLYRLSVHR